MAGTAGPFKTYARGNRTSETEQSFQFGMFDTLGALPDGALKALINYDIVNTGENLQPRAGIRTSRLFIPNIAAESGETDYHDPDAGFILHDALETIEEDGKTYYQFIVSKCNRVDNLGQLYVVTGADALDSTSRDALPYKVSIRKEIQDDDLALGYTMLNTLDAQHPAKAGCLFDKPVEAKIHGISMMSDARMESFYEYFGMTAPSNETIAALVGTWAYGSSYYFLTQDQTESEENIKLYRTKFNNATKLYEIEAVELKQPMASEAGTYGINMLLDSPQNFPSLVDSGTTDVDLHGMMLYVDGNIELYPRKNKKYLVSLNYSAQPGTSKYLIKFLWREQADVSWNEFHSYYLDMTDRAVGATLPAIEKKLMFPSKDVMIRAEVYKQITPTSEQKLGIDYFTVNTRHFEIAALNSTLIGFYLDRVVEKSLENTAVVSYDLRTAKGMGFWMNRLYLFGVPKDPKILFLSDLNDPGYFPFPTCAISFDEPVVAAVPYLGQLLVFTTKKVILVAANADGVTWKKTTVQDNLSIAPWDRNLIQTVKNMVFFKSGNYFYMMVPKSASLTGELTLAPVSTPITEFLNSFEARVYEYLRTIYPALLEQELKDVLPLVDYYNYLDYEDVHNVYVFQYHVVSIGMRFIHVDLQYNYVNRTWKLYVYEGQSPIKPYKNDSTAKGETMASTFFTDLEVQAFVELTTTNIDGAAERVTDELILRSAPTDNRHLYRLRYSYKSDDRWISTIFEEPEFDPTNERLVYHGPGNRTVVLPVKASDTYGIRLIDHDSKSLVIPTQWKLERESDGAWELMTSGNVVWPLSRRTFRYTLSAALTRGAVLKIQDRTYIINSINDGVYKDTTRNGDDLTIKLVSGTTYQFIFDYDLPDNLPPVIQTFAIDSEAGGSTQGRCIQFFKSNLHTHRDFYIPETLPIKCPNALNAEGLSELDKVDMLGRIAKALADAMESGAEAAENAIAFPNWQYLDTGNRDYVLEYNKRFRELQLRFNNSGGSKLEFGMAFSIDDIERSPMYAYSVEQVLDSEDPNYGLLYITPTPVEYPELTVPGEIRLNSWLLDETVFPTISLWKARVPLGGKGYSPRFKLLSRNQTDYTILSYTWVFRMMYMR